MEQKKCILIILDGMGLSASSYGNAVDQAQTPCIDKMLSNYPHSSLLASGEAVGIPKGQMGNSEVGHMNIGAGRIVHQDLSKIDGMIQEGSFATLPTLHEMLDRLKQKNTTLHIMGLASNGGVHAHLNHLYALIDFFLSHQIKHIALHLFTDGRDCDPYSGLEYCQEVEKKIKATSASIVSIIGRYYAMDRDQRWERTQKAYELLVKGKGENYQNVSQAIQASYKADISDEFILPCTIGSKEGTQIKGGDTLLCYNFRTDRARQLCQALHQQDFPDFDMHKLAIHLYSMTCYDDNFKDVKYIIEKNAVENTLGEVLSRRGKKQLRIAETEKYPHVTFFFNGGQEKAFDLEDRIMVPSPKVKTYDLQPWMSAQEMTDKLMERLSDTDYDFICLNYANPDMVGHTGDLKAVIKAVETVDGCLDKLLGFLIKKQYTCLIIADHGNAEFMLNADGSPNTAHTSNKVPAIIIDKDKKNIQDGKLGDIAPSILKLLALPIPQEMNGNIIF